MHVGAGILSRRLAERAWVMMAIPGRSNMNRRGIAIHLVAAMLFLAGALPASNAFAQAKSLKDQVVGVWALVSWELLQSHGDEGFRFGRRRSQRPACPHRQRAFVRSDHFRVSETRIQKSSQDHRRGRQGHRTRADILFRCLHGQRSRQVTLFSRRAQFLPKSGEGKRRQAALHDCGRRIEVHQSWPVGRWRRHVRVEADQIGAAQARPSRWPRIATACQSAS